MKKSLICAAALVLQSVVPATASSVDGVHEPFDALLRAHVTDGQVDYPAFAGSPLLDRYLTVLEKTDPEALGSRDARLAYWINAYNALAIRGILDGRSPSSFFGRVGYFKNARYDVARQSLTLHQVEHEVIIPMGEPRIHFAIVCASTSCPKLLSEAYQPATLDVQLESSTRDFINDESRNRFDRDGKVARLSKIFDWFRSDFERDGEGVLDFVARFVDDPALAQELRSGGWRIEHLRYDWSLNGTPPRG